MRRRRRKRGFSLRNRWKGFFSRLRIIRKRYAEPGATLILMFAALATMGLWYKFVRPVATVGPAVCDDKVAVVLHYPEYVGIDDTSTLHLKAYNVASTPLTATVVLHLVPVEHVEIVGGGSTIIELKKVPPQATVSKDIIFRVPGHMEMANLNTIGRRTALITMTLSLVEDSGTSTSCILRSKDEGTEDVQAWHVYAAPFYHMRALGWGGLLLSFLSAFSGRLVKWLGWKE
ncbi:hypothetical protein D6833_07300 [Candidatus Parcubacteria bacterium]|nr:MAG: hypothetical protein D6833_07300 [Candidatus Parcubacteria bacterium]